MNLRDLAARILGPPRFVRARVRFLVTPLWRRLMFRTTVIAITGSVGKSTTKECLAAILAAHGKTLKTPGNENSTWGVPRSVIEIRPWHRYAVIEIGTETPGQIRNLARLVQPDIAVVLCVARTHVRSFPTLDDTAAEKATLLEYLRPNGTAILNGDDPRVRKMAEGLKQRVVFYGDGPDCNLKAEDVGDGAWPERLKFTLRADGERLAVQTQLLGTHWVSAALASIAAAQACGLTAAEAARGLADVPPFEARMQPIRLPSGAIVIRDEETSSPDTLAPMFNVMRKSTAERRVLIFSDVDESKERPRKRLEEIGQLAAELTDLVVFIGEHGHHGVRAAINAGLAPESCYHTQDLQEAAEILQRELRDGDLVFVKGKMTDHLSRVVFAQYGPIGCRTTACRLRPVCESCDQLQPGFDLQETLAASAAAVRLSVPAQRA